MDKKSNEIRSLEPIKKNKRTKEEINAEGKKWANERKKNKEGRTESSIVVSTGERRSKFEVSLSVSVEDEASHYVNYSQTDWNYIIVLKAKPVFDGKIFNS